MGNMGNIPEHLCQQLYFHVNHGNSARFMNNFLDFPTTFAYFHGFPHCHTYFPLDFRTKNIIHRFSHQQNRFQRLPPDFAWDFSTDFVDSHAARAPFVTAQLVTALVLFYGGKLVMEGQMHASSLLSFVRLGE